MTKANLSGNLVVDNLYHDSKRQTSAIIHGGLARQCGEQSNLRAQSCASFSREERQATEIIDNT